MKRLFGNLRLLPDALLKTSTSGRNAATAVECPNCGTLARSVDCKANVASRAGGSSTGGGSSGSSSSRAVPGSTLSAARHRGAQQQQCGVSSHAAVRPQPASQQQQHSAAAAGLAVREAQRQGTAGSNMTGLLLAGGLGTAGGIAIASM
jgi:hypothetical protein